MQFNFSPYIPTLILAFLISLWIAFYSWTRPKNRSAVALSILAVLIAVWLLGYALEIAGSDLETKRFWGQVEYIGIALIPVTWFVFAFLHAFRNKSIGRFVYAALGVIPAITIGLVFTTNIHGMIWKTISIVEQGQLSVLKVSYGPWFWIHTAYSYLLLLIGAAFIVRSIGLRKGMFRGQTIALLIAVASPWVGNIFYLMKWNPFPYLDLTPFAFTISLVSLAWGILGFDLVDLSPFARDFIIDRMDDGVIVFDAGRRITDINPGAQRILGEAIPFEIGKNASELITYLPLLFTAVVTGEEQHGDFRVGKQPARWFEFNLLLLKDKKQRKIGSVLTVHEITERKKNEERLSQLHHAVESSPTSIVITDLNGKIEYVNPKFTQVTGYSLEEALNQNPRILKTDLTPPETYADLWGTISSGNEWHGEFCNRKKNGELYWELASISPIMDPSGKITHFVAVKEDITPQRQLQDRLRQKNSYLSILHEVTLDLLNRRNPDDLLQTIVNQAERLLATPYIEILLKEGDHLVLRSCTYNHSIPVGSILSRNEALLSWKAHDERRTIVLDDYPAWLGAHSHYFALELSAVAVFPILIGDLCIGVLGVGRTAPDQQYASDEIQIGQLFARLVAVVLDNANLYSSALEEIAERKRSQILLQQSEMRYRQIVENASDLIYRTDVQGDFEYVNPPTLHLLGYPDEQALLGKPYSELVLSEYREPVRDFYRKQIDARILTTYLEFQANANDGSTIWLGQNVQLITAGSEIVGLQAVARDISERKQAEVSMALARDQALEASQLKSQLLAKVSHELRTPLGGILGFSELLRHGSFGSMNSKQVEALDQVIESVQFLNEMVNELLDEAQLSAQKTVLRMETISIAALLRRVEANMSVLAMRKSLQLSFTLAQDMPNELIGDAGRLQQILVNIIGNAIKFTPSGNIGVEVSRQSLNSWKIQVADTGVGIAKESLQTIFEPFHQVNNDLIFENRGTGLGLTITKQVVELMGGKIMVESEAGRGSVFTVCLPLIDNLERSHGKTTRLDR
jgi:PAS domain S-box-containing protein